MSPEQAAAQVHALLGGAPRRRDLLIEYLHRLHDQAGHLCAAQLAALAQALQLPAGELAQIAAAWPQFHLVGDAEPLPPALTVRVCAGLPCELAGAADLLRQLPALLGREARVAEAACVGRCEQAPAALVGHNPVPCASPRRVTDTVHEGATEHEPEGYIGLSQYRAAGGYVLLNQCLGGERTVAQVIDALAASGLGSGGPAAARRWQRVRGEPGPRLLAAAVGTGQPGDFLDRVYVERDPHRLLEGLLIAAWAIGAETAYLHVQDDDHGCRRLLEQELERLQADPPAAGLPRIELRRGAGCGEAAALFASIEGGRPEDAGADRLFGRPALAHDVETLYWLRDLLEHGSDWFSHKGVNGRHGLRAFAVSGRVQEPGVKLAPAGTTIQELIDEHCGGMLDGHAFYAWLPHGAWGGILPAQPGDTPLDPRTPQVPDDAVRSAGLVVLSHRDSATAAVRNLLRFFNGRGRLLCASCRGSTVEAATLLQAERPEALRLTAIAQATRQACRCGRGPAIGAALDDLVQHFPQELR